MKQFSRLAAALLAAVMLVCLPVMGAATGAEPANDVQSGTGSRILRDGADGFMTAGESGILLESGGVLVVQNAGSQEKNTVDFGSGTVSGSGAVFRVERRASGTDGFTLIEVFSGAVQIALNESAQQAELVSGKAMLIQEAEACFIAEDALDAALWNTAGISGLTVQKQGSGSAYLPIPYETLPKPVMQALLDCLLEGRILSVEEEAVQRLLTVGHYYLQTTLKNSTCTEDGLAQFDCTFCGSSYTQEILCRGHEISVQPAVPATCQADGITESQTCTRCGELLVPAEVIPQLPHQPVTDAGAEPTCLSEGLTEGSHCSVCGEVLTAQQVIPALPHTEVTDAGYPETCTEPGLSDGIHCSVCNQVLVPQTVIPARGHTEDIVPGYPATCFESGLSDGLQCSVCGLVLQTQSVLPSGHIPAEDTVSSTSYTDQTVCYSNLRFCKVCNQILERENISHTTNGETRMESTVGCYRAVLQCSVCGLILDSREVDHIVFETKTRDEMTGKDMITGACSICGKILYQHEQ